MNIWRSAHRAVLDARWVQSRFSTGLDAYGRYLELPPRLSSPVSARRFGSQIFLGGNEMADQIADRPARGIRYRSLSNFYLTRRHGVGVRRRTAGDFSGVRAQRAVFPTSNAGDWSSRAAAVPRRHINARLMAFVGATAVITAPATALLLELRPA
jgi:hypothetical protein